MAIGLDTDGEYARRSSIPSGGAGTLSGGGFSDFFVGVWVYRDSADATYGNTSDGAILHFQAGAREVKLGFDNTFGGGTASDPLLQVIFNSGGGTGATQTFASANFLDEWVYYFFYENSANSQVAGYIRLSDLATAVTITRANDNAGSQYVNTLTFGSDSGGAAVAAGNYAFARAVNDSGLTASDVLAYAASDVTETGDWGFWPLADNADTGDDSGNGRTLTFSSGLTSESDPTLGGGGFTSSGALDSPVSTIAGTATHLTLHATSGALASQAATMAGAAVSPHLSTGALASQASSVAGAVTHLTLHTSSGALESAVAAIAGAAAHEHASTGALASQAAAIDGAAEYTAGGSFSSSGALASQEASASGVAVRLALHTTSGALEAQSAQASGAAAHEHASSGALASAASEVSGSAEHTTPGVFATAGDPVSADAEIAGSAAHLTLHVASGDLLSGEASIMALATGPDVAPTRRFGGFSRQRRNYVYKGRRYQGLTNEELLRLIAQDAIDVTREDIKVSYKNQKPHIIAKDAWADLQKALESLGKLDQVEYDDEDDIESIIALL